MYNLRRTPDERLYDMEINMIGAKGDLIPLSSTMQSVKDNLILLEKFLETSDAFAYVDNAACVSMKTCAAEINAALFHMRNALTLLPYPPKEIYKPEEEEGEEEEE